MCAAEQLAAERAVCDDGDALAAAVLEQTVLDRPIRDVVAELIRHDLVSPELALSVPQLGNREVAEADEAHFAGVDELLHGSHRLADRNIAVRLVKLEQIDRLDAESA